ncbi:MAG: hypothetical protein D9V47_13050 [Clostridia bacterium]|nr:MAG: hypothetical protein D9V47_13050 [Clostridia bacterium]
MDVSIISSLPAFTGLLRENMAHPEPAGGVNGLITGRLAGWETGLLVWEAGATYFPPELAPVQYIIGVGRVETPVPYLKTPDILLSGEVHLEDGQVCASYDRLIDLALKSGEELAQALPGKVLVAQLWAEAPRGEAHPELFGVSRPQSRVAALAWEQGIPFLSLNAVAAGGDDEGEGETAKKLFWMVKGTLENLRICSPRAKPLE